MGRVAIYRQVTKGSKQAVHRLYTRFYTRLSAS
nr:MAG TPA: hypothetical protein [Caudoviricetes sp.]